MLSENVDHGAYAQRVKKELGNTVRYVINSNYLKPAKRELFYLSNDNSVIFQFG
jgi:hypothetical protein